MAHRFDAAPKKKSVKLSAMKRIHLHPRDILLAEGDKSDEMYLLESGRLSVFINRKGQEIKLGEIGDNELVGEISFLDRQPRSASVVALVSCDLVVIPRENFEAQLSEQPAWVTGLVKTLATRLRDANSRIKI